ncbi:S-adenosyl-L-homocysteine hydrolase [Novosphingobium aquae]|uniref:S-adenosyl-L-homocysteine hydrolase n=1 Tax=Novosphingobium aquae TaxID=3133435 RepID=A0ABU8S7G2_9SPHN
MKSFIRKAAFSLAASGLLLATPSQASTGGTAEKLRRLDIMLMVTGLRCRNGAHDFQADFQNFEAAHLPALNSAAAQLRDGFEASHGANGAERALDRMSTVMANQYGAGHPWLECGELKIVARSLAQMQGTEALIEAADQLLAGSGSPAQLTWVRR